MPNNIKDYIKRMLERGQNIEQIKTSLINAGWHPEKIESHIKELSPKSSRKVGIILLLLTIIVLISYFAYKNFKQDTNQEIGLSDINKKIDLFIERGNELCSEGKYIEALAEFDKAIELNQTKARGYYNKGKCYVSIERYEEAIHEFTKAIQRYSKGKFYHYNLGLTYCKAGLYEKGIESLNRAIKINSTEQKFYQTLSECYIKIGDINNSLLALNKSAQLRFR